MTALTLGLLGGQLWLRPLWRHRRQLLLRYLEPELLRLQHDLLNLSATEAELHLDIQPTAYANRVLVEAVAAQCRAAGISPARCAMARLAVCLITLHRDNLMQDPTYGQVTSWELLMEEAATEIDHVIATTAWERALRDAYVYQHVYMLMFLVIEGRAFRARLLMDERPRVQRWHQHLADLIACVMQEHGHATPRAAALAQRGTPRSVFARRRTRFPAG